MIRSGGCWNWRRSWGCKRGTDFFDLRSYGCLLGIGVQGKLMCSVK